VLLPTSPCDRENLRSLKGSLGKSSQYQSVTVFQPKGFLGKICWTNQELRYEIDGQLTALALPDCRHWRGHNFLKHTGSLLAGRAFFDVLRASDSYRSHLFSMKPLIREIDGKVLKVPRRQQFHYGSKRGFRAGVRRIFTFRKLASADRSIVFEIGQNGNNLIEQLKSTPLTQKKTLALPPRKEWAALRTEFPLRTTIWLNQGFMNNMLLSSRVKPIPTLLFRTCSLISILGLLGLVTFANPLKRTRENRDPKGDGAETRSIFFCLGKDSWSSDDRISDRKFGLLVWDEFHGLKIFAFHNLAFLGRVFGKPD